MRRGDAWRRAIMMDITYDGTTGIATWRTSEIMKDTFERSTAPWHRQVLGRVTSEVERLRVLDGKHARAVLVIETGLQDSNRLT